MATPIGTPLKTGLLSKRSRNRNTHFFNFSSAVGNWNERMVSLFPTHIKYDAPNGTPKGIFALTSTSKVLVSDVDKKSYCFKVITENEELYLDCNNEQTRQEWMIAIKAATDPVIVAESNELLLQEEKKRMEEIIRIQKENELREELRLLAVKEAKEKRIKIIESLKLPHVCNKKLSNELKYSERYVWLEFDKFEFHWGKNGEYTFHSKAVNLKTHVQYISKLSDNSFSLVLVEKEKLPTHLFRPGFVFDPAVPTTIDIFLESAEDCTNFIDFMNEMKNSPNPITV